jgi:ribose transport system ATP-binding protein
MAFVELAGIVKNFGGVQALKGVDLAVELGQTHALLGENGAGKSTLIRILTGAHHPDAGDIRIDGEACVFHRPQEAQALGIAAVYQEPMVYPHLSVLENVFAGREVCNVFGIVRRMAMRRKVAPWLDQLKMPAALLERPMSSLTLGWQQLVMIAQALVQNARVIIFDEPTSILSQAETDRLFDIINRLRADGRGVVYITHRLDEVPRIADRVTVLTDGRVSGSFPIGEVSPERLLTLMAGRAVRDPASELRAPLRARSAAGARDESTVPGAPVLEVRGLTREGLFRDVSWLIPAGAVTGIYGLVGSGRSEVALSVFGYLRGARGSVLLNGEKIAPRDPADAIRLGIGYLPEDRKLQGIFASKSLEGNLTANTLDRFTGPLGRLDFSALIAEASRAMANYNIKARDAASPIAALSGGNQQKGLFARWAGRALKVLILDEPTRGIDIRTKEEIHRFIRDLATQGLAVVVISSDLPEVLAVSDQVIVMRQGRVACECRGEAMTAETILAAAIGTRTEAA